MIVQAKDLRFYSDPIWYGQLLTGPHWTASGKDGEFTLVVQGTEKRVPIILDLQGFDYRRGKIRDDCFFQGLGSMLPGREYTLTMTGLCSKPTAYRAQFDRLPLESELTYCWDVEFHTRAVWYYIHGVAFNEPLTRFLAGTALKDQEDPKVTKQLRKQFRNWDKMRYNDTVAIYGEKVRVIKKGKR